MAAAFVATPFIYQVQNNSTYVKAYASSVGAGNLLWCFTWQYNASQTCTGVADDVNGAWTKAFGPVRGSSSNGDAALYGWYKPNSAAGGSPTAGTVTATWSGSGYGGIVIGSVSGLGGGGTLDQVLSTFVSGVLSEVNMGSTATLAQSVEAAVGMAIGSNLASAALDAAWTFDVAPNYYYYERVIRQITSTNAALNPKWTYSSTLYESCGMMSFKDAAVSVVSGGATLGDVTAGGGASVVPSDVSGGATLGDVTSAGVILSGGGAVSGGATLDEMAATGTLAPTPGTITGSPLVSNAGPLGGLQTSVSIEAFAHNPSTGALAVMKTGLVTSVSGVPSFSDSLIVPGTSYRVVWRVVADGAEGLETLTAT